MEELKELFVNYLELLFGETKYLKVDKMFDDFFIEMKSSKGIELCKKEDCYPVNKMCDSCFTARVYANLEFLTFDSSNDWSVLSATMEESEDSFQVELENASGPEIIMEIAKKVHELLLKDDEAIICCSKCGDECSIDNLNDWSPSEKENFQCFVCTAFSKENRRMRANCIQCNKECKIIMSTERDNFVCLDCCTL